MNAPSAEPWELAWRRLCSGDSAAWRVLLPALQPTVYGIALRMLGSRAAAEDLTQEVFMQLHLNRSQIADARHLRHWLCRVASNRAIDQLRRQRPAVQAADGLPIDDSGAEGAGFAGEPQLERRLLSQIGKLAPPVRAALLLRYQEDLDPGEIAALLGMPVNTVKSHLRRALDTLRGSLE